MKDKKIIIQKLTTFWDTFIRWKFLWLGSGVIIVAARPRCVLLCSERVCQYHIHKEDSRVEALSKLELWQLFPQLFSASTIHLPLGKWRAYGTACSDIGAEFWYIFLFNNYWEKSFSSLHITPLSPWNFNHVFHFKFNLPMFTHVI